MNLDPSRRPWLLHHRAGYLDNIFLAEVGKVYLGGWLSNRLDETAPVPQDKELYILVVTEVMYPASEANLLALVSCGLRRKKSVHVDAVLQK